MAEIEHAHAASRDLVLIRRTNPATGGANLFTRGALPVEQLVIRQHQMRAITDVETSFDVDPISDESIDLGEQRVGIEHDTIADRAPHARVQNSTRNLTKHELRVADVHGVAGIRAALIAHYPIRTLGEHID